jgi:hypothetical protein
MITLNIQPKHSYVNSIHIDSDGNGIGESYVSITLSNTTLSFEDLSNANALVVL